MKAAWLVIYPDILDGELKQQYLHSDDANF